MDDPEQNSESEDHELNQHGVEPPEHEDEEAISLEDLGAAYAMLGGGNEDEPLIEDDGHPEQSADFADGQTVEDVDFDDDEGELAIVPTPQCIVEGALFVGHPKNEPLTATRIASLMRDVSAEEVDGIIETLNDSYRTNRQALRIVREEIGYVMSISPEGAEVRNAFMGKVRETRLNQPAIDVLALVAYQPGITAGQITDQRGRDSGPILNQLVRRQMLMVERIKPEGGGRAVVHYYPTERFLYLFELESLQDLPLVEESLG